MDKRYQKIVGEASEISRTLHKNQMYGGVPYFEGHILPVVGNTLMYFSHHGIPYNPEVVATAYLHDAAEDQLDGFMEYASTLTPRILLSVMLLTDVSGKTRGETKALTYENVEKMKELYDEFYSDDSDIHHAYVPQVLQYTLIVKWADRLANVQSGAKNDMYRDEHSKFSNTYMHPVFEESLRVFTEPVERILFG